MMSRLSRFARGNAFGVVALVFLAVFILGPIITVILWAFTERWRYPSLLPTQWGLSYWSETLSRGVRSSADRYPAAFATATLAGRSRRSLII